MRKEVHIGWVVKNRLFHLRGLKQELAHVLADEIYVRKQEGLETIEHKIKITVEHYPKKKRKP